MMTTRIPRWTAFVVPALLATALVGSTLGFSGLREAIHGLTADSNEQAYLAFPHHPKRPSLKAEATTDGQGDVKLARAASNNSI